MKDFKWIVISQKQSIKVTIESIAWSKFATIIDYNDILMTSYFGKILKKIKQ